MFLRSRLQTLADDAEKILAFVAVGDSQHWKIVDNINKRK